MTRFGFELDIGDRVRVTYGYDAASGYFVRIRRGYPGREIADYDRHSDGYNGLQGLLKTLVSAGIFTAQETADAVNLVFHGGDLDKLRDEDVGLAAIVVLDLANKRTK